MGSSQLVGKPLRRSHNCEVGDDYIRKRSDDFAWICCSKAYHTRSLVAPTTQSVDAILEDYTVGWGYTEATCGQQIAVGSGLGSGKIACR